MDKIISLLLFSILASFGCQKKMQDVITITPAEKAQFAAKSILQNDFDISLSSNEKFALFTKKMTAMGKGFKPTLQVVVYDLDGEQVLFNQKIPKGNAHWKDENNLVMWSIPGRMAPDLKIEKRIFNVIDGTTKNIRE